MSIPKLKFRNFQFQTYFVFQEVTALHFCFLPGRLLFSQFLPWFTISSFTITLVLLHDKVNTTLVILIGYRAPIQLGGSWHNVSLPHLSVYTAQSTTRTATFVLYVNDYLIIIFFLKRHNWLQCLINIDIRTKKEVMVSLHQALLLHHHHLLPMIGGLNSLYSWG